MNSNIFQILIIGAVLSADSFSAALAMGFRKHTIKDSLKFALSSGGAEAIVAFLGAIAGNVIVKKFDQYDHWISFLLLLGVALHMIYEGICEFMDKDKDKDKEEAKEEKKFHSFIKVLIVSFATSLDAFAVGVTLGVSENVLWPYIVSIGSWAFATTLLGMYIARRASKKIGPIFNLIGGIILGAMGVMFLIDGLK